MLQRVAIAGSAWTALAASTVGFCSAVRINRSVSPRSSSSQTCRRRAKALRRGAGPAPNRAAQGRLGGIADVSGGCGDDAGVCNQGLQGSFTSKFVRELPEARSLQCQHSLQRTRAHSRSFREAGKRRGRFIDHRPQNESGGVAECASIEEVPLLRRRFFNAGDADDQSRVEHVVVEVDSKRRFI